MWHFWRLICVHLCLMAIILLTTVFAMNWRMVLPGSVDLALAGGYVFGAFFLPFLITLRPMNRLQERLESDALRAADRCPKCGYLVSGLFHCAECGWKDSEGRGA